MVGLLLIMLGLVFINVINPLSGSSLHLKTHIALDKVNLIINKVASALDEFN